MHNHLELPSLPATTICAALRVLMAEQGLLPQQIIESTGQCLARLAQYLLADDVVDRPVVVLAGRGGNGASGLVAARYLLDRNAWVQIVLTHPPEEYQGEAAQQVALVEALGAPLAWAEEGWELPPADLVIDALIGYGLQGAPHGKVRELIHLANSSVAPILSLAAPSGWDMQTGALAGPHIQATATLLMTLPPAALVRQPGRGACGDLYLADSGILPQLYTQLGLSFPPFFTRDTTLPLDVENDRVFVRTIL